MNESDPIPDARISTPVQNLAEGDPVDPSIDAVAPQTSGLAIASLVLGILGILTACVGVGLVLGIVGLVLGIVALGQIADVTKNLRGQGMAIAGVVLGGLTSLSAPVALLGILLPSLSAARQAAYRMQGATQVRAIQQSLVTFAQSNNGFYVGFEADGRVRDTRVEGRYQLMLEEGMFPSELLISPLDKSKTPWSVGPVTADHYSYALLQVDHPGGRRDEWQDTTNPQAALISDRNTGSLDAPQSIHANQGGDWRGNVGWNDNHVEFTSTPVVETRYGDGPVNLQDYLFDSPGDDDAWLIHSGR